MPDTILAKKAGIDLGERGGIVVDDFLHVVSQGKVFQNIFAGGDCCEVTDLVTGEKRPVQLATTARKMAGVISSNICGKNEVLGPILGPSIYVAGEILIGSVGMTDLKAKRSNENTVSGYALGSSRSGAYPGGSELHIKVIFREGKLVGAQIIGREGVKERIDALSFLISKEATIEEMVKMETCYSPPVGTVVDPLIYAVKDALKKRNMN